MAEADRALLNLPPLSVEPPAVKTPATVEDDSVTESETEPEPDEDILQAQPEARTGTKRKLDEEEEGGSISTGKKAKSSQPVEDDSVTEPESETEPESDEDYLPNTVNINIFSLAREYSLCKVGVQPTSGHETTKGSNLPATILPRTNGQNHQVAFFIEYTLSRVPTRRGDVLL